MIDQNIIDRAVRIATKAALAGKPVARVVWVPPKSAASDPLGSFYVQEHVFKEVSETLPWDS